MRRRLAQPSAGRGPPRARRRWAPGRRRRGRGSRAARTRPGAARPAGLQPALGDLRGAMAAPGSPRASTPRAWRPRWPTRSRRGATIAEGSRPIGARGDVRLRPHLRGRRGCRPRPVGPSSVSTRAQTSSGRSPVRTVSMAVLTPAPPQAASKRSATAPGADPDPRLRGGAWARRVTAPSARDPTRAEVSGTVPAVPPVHRDATPPPASRPEHRRGGVGDRDGRTRRADALVTASWPSGGRPVRRATRNGRRRGPGRTSPAATTSTRPWG